jgi:2-keto-3-deoxy-L-rhamnonate aldolase RhmA
MDCATEVRRRLYAGERVYGTMAFEFFTPGLIPLLHATGCEYVVHDMEHSGAGIETIKQQIAYARGLEIAVWVRVPELRYAVVAGVLDAGADGVMVPIARDRGAGQAAGPLRPLPAGRRARLRLRHGP